MYFFGQTSKFVCATLLSYYRFLHLKKTSELGVYQVTRQPNKIQLLDRFLYFLKKSFNFKPKIFGNLKLPKIKGMFSDMNEGGSTNPKRCVPNDAARGMKKLDRTLFSCTAKVLGIAVPNGIVAQFRKVFKTSILRLPNVKPVANLMDSDPLQSTHKLVLLDSNLYNAPDDFILKSKDKLEQMSVEGKLCRFYDLELDYKNWNYDEILKWILPKEYEGIGGFSIIGHIAHFNLKDELLDYKEVIGEVILDKVSCVKTVVNKLHTIDNTFRNFKMEVLAGEENYVTITKEHGFTYELDFSKIYWNPRLSNEHLRIVTLTSPGDVVFDVFAGIGPFSIPCAKKGCKVYANDLNPNSVHWLKKNLKHNKIPDDRIDIFTMDGRDFIRTVVKRELKNLFISTCNEKLPFEKLIHIPMNLPAMAVEFLDAFPGLLAEDDNFSHASSAAGNAIDEIKPTESLIKNIELKGLSNIIVHCYSFSKEADPENDITQKIRNILNLDFITFYGIGVKRVRNVAPNKEMLCASFKLPWDLLLKNQSGLADRKDDIEGEEPRSKKIKF